MTKQALAFSFRKMMMYTQDDSPFDVLHSYYHIYRLMVQASVSPRFPLHQPPLPPKQAALPTFGIQTTIPSGVMPVVKTPFPFRTITPTIVPTTVHRWNAARVRIMDKCLASVWVNYPLLQPQVQRELAVLTFTIPITIPPGRKPRARTNVHCPLTTRMIVPTTPPCWPAARVRTVDRVLERAWQPCPVHPPPLPPRPVDLACIIPITARPGRRVLVSMTVHCQVDVLPILARGDVVLLRMADRLVISASVMPLAFVMLVTVGQRRRGWLLEVVLSLFVRKDEHERKR